MLLQRVGVGRAGLDIQLHLSQDLAQALVVCLRGEDFKTLHERQPGIDHRRELPGEDYQVFVGDLLFLFAERLGFLFFLDRGNSDALRP